MRFKGHVKIFIIAKNTTKKPLLSHIGLHLHPTTGLVLDDGGSDGALGVQGQLLWLLRLVVRLDFRAAELRDVLQKDDGPRERRDINPTM